MPTWIILTTEPYVKLGQVLLTLPCFPVVSAYFLMVAFSNPWQKYVPAFSLKKGLVAYNVICVLLSAVVAFYCLYGCYDAGTVFTLEYSWYIRVGCWLYLASKYLELLDTVFMVLRHRSRQISFLQVYHHSSVLLLADYVSKWAAFPPMAFIMGLNSIIHVFLYAYYAKTALGTTSKLSWKKSLTLLQISQFIITIVHTGVGHIYYNFCLYSCAYMSSMLVLFVNFYYWAYVYKKSEKKL